MSRSLELRRIAQLLKAQAENARISPFGYDQLLAVALDAAAAPGETHVRVLAALRQPADPIEQLYLRRDVFSQQDAVVAKAVAKAAPGWVSRRAGIWVRHNPKLLASWLRAAADLNADLWDHPALPVAPGFRGLMLTCVGALRERALLISRAKGRRYRPSASQHATQGAMA